MHTKLSAFILCLMLFAVLLPGACANSMPVNTNIDSHLSSIVDSSIQGYSYSLVFRYGEGWSEKDSVISGRYNELDTSQETYTKDLVSLPSVTAHLELSQSEMTQIYEKMQSIGFFEYPSDFAIKLPPGSVTTIVTPSQLYYFEVIVNSTVKTLLWNDNILNPDAQATQLRDLIQLIKSIIESKAEYKALPPASGGYL